MKQREHTWKWTGGTQGLPKLTNLVAISIRYCQTHTADIKAGCTYMGCNVSEGYSSKRLFWLVCGKPLGA